MKSIGVRSFLFAVLSVLTAIPVLWLGSALATRFGDEVRTRRDQSLAVAARSVSWQLEQMLETRRRDLELLASSLESMEALDGESAKELLLRHWKRSGYYTGTYVGDADGNALIRTPSFPADAPPAGNYRDRDYYQDLIRTRKTAVSRVQIGKFLGVTNVQIAAPILDQNGGLRGYAEGSVDLGAFSELVARHAREVSGSRILILDGTTRVVADSRQTGDTGLRDLSALPLLRRPDGEDALRNESDERGVSVHGTVHAVGGPLVGWSVAAFAPQADLERHATEARNRTWLAAMLAWLAALGLSGLIANRFGRRFGELASTVRAIGRGDLARRVAPVAGWEPKEISVLVGQIDQMAEQLEKQTGHLQEMVAARTSELATVNERLTTLVNALERAGDGIEITGPDTTYIYANPALEEITGYTASELLGQTPRLLIPDFDDGESYRLIWEECRAGKVHAAVSLARRKDGSLFEQELTVWPIQDPNGQITHFVGLRRDITERCVTERALRVSERMASVGTLAAGVAHEINNPLTYVLLSLRQIENHLYQHADRLPADFAERTGSAVEYAVEGAERVEAIVKDLRMFSRVDDESVQAVDPRAVLDSALRMVKNDIRHRARLVRDYGPMPAVLANRARLSQVFLNLLVNAVQSLEGGDAQQDEIRVRATTDTEGNAVVEISDTGPGIRPEHLARIFDPFFSTKPVGVGTGLGLSMCHNVVKSMQGQIRVTSTFGRGATFSVTLPPAPEAVEPFPISSSRPNLVHRAARSRILIIDDDRAVAEALRQALSHHVTTTVNNAEAALWAIRRSEFDVILCDIMMPGMTGLELYKCLGTVRPDHLARVVFITGGVLTATARAFLADTHAPWLEKPVSEEQLDATIAQVLVLRDGAAGNSSARA
jgi:PAS domain S-box-containing protein